MLEMIIAKQTTTIQSHNQVTERCSERERLEGDGVASAAFDRILADANGFGTFDGLFHAAPHAPILTLLGAGAEESFRKIVPGAGRESRIKNRDYCYRRGEWLAR